MNPPVTLRGFLGWGNRKSGLEAYGPGGRWHGADRNGDLLGDALEREGGYEGASLLVVAVNRFGDVTALDDIERFARERDIAGHSGSCCVAAGTMDLRPGQATLPARWGRSPNRDGR